MNEAVSITQVEWSSRHVRLGYEVMLFSFIFLIWNIFDVEFKFPFFSFGDAKPVGWLYKSLFLILSVWFLIGFIAQTKREKTRNVSISKKAMDLLDELQGTHRQMIGDLHVYQPFPALEKYLSEIHKFKKEFSKYSDKENNLAISRLLQETSQLRAGLDPVSYTHLTLPTIYSV